MVCRPGRVVNAAAADECVPPLLLGSAATSAGVWPGGGPQAYARRGPMAWTQEMPLTDRGAMTNFTRTSSRPPNHG